MFHILSGWNCLGKRKLLSRDRSAHTAKRMCPTEHCNTGETPRARTRAKVVISCPTFSNADHCEHYWLLMSHQLLFWFHPQGFVIWKTNPWKEKTKWRQRLWHRGPTILNAWCDIWIHQRQKCTIIVSVSDQTRSKVMYLCDMCNYDWPFSANSSTCRTLGLSALTYSH